jgi:hypothetical protein
MTTNIWGWREYFSPLPNGSPFPGSFIWLGPPASNLERFSSTGQLLSRFLSERIPVVGVFWMIQIPYGLLFSRPSSSICSWWLGLIFQCGLHFGSGLPFLDFL